ncbi:alpha/beta fold hydrolase, partial [Staphylococcus aureus]
QPIVLLHGTSASLHTWDGWAATLAPTRRVIRMDLPGFGLTGPSPAHDYTQAAYARFVVAVLDTLGVKQQVVLAGNSLGGSVAWKTAADAPQRVARLVLVDS